MPKASSAAAIDGQETVHPEPWTASASGRPPHRMYLRQYKRRRLRAPATVLNYRAPIAVPKSVVGQLLGWVTRPMDRKFFPVHSKLSKLNWPVPMTNGGHITGAICRNHLGDSVSEVLDKARWAAVHSAGGIRENCHQSGVSIASLSRGAVNERPHPARAGTSGLDP